MFNIIFLRQILCNSRRLYRNIGVKRMSNVKVNHFHLPPRNISNIKSFPIRYYTALSILSWLGFVDDDEQKESELIMTLKRSVLATNREQYDKAEQLLHLALRIAQQQQNEQGITYCYDLMANVAFNRYELDKAEKLFVNVLQRLLSTGTSQDDLKVSTTLTIMHFKALYMF